MLHCGLPLASSRPSLNHVRGLFGLPSFRRPLAGRATGRLAVALRFIQDELAQVFGCDKEHRATGNARGAAVRFHRTRPSRVVRGGLNETDRHSAAAENGDAPLARFDG